MPAAGSPSHPATPAPAPKAPARALIDRQIVMLAELAEIGMEIARAAGRRAAALAEGGEADERGADPGLTYARAARAVRLTLALQSRLAGEQAALGRAEAGRRRRRIHARVEQAIEAEPDDADHDGIERLWSAAWEQLTETEDDDLLDLPLDEMVARVCRDLGLSATWAEGFAAPDDARSHMDHLPPPAAPSGRATSPALAGEKKRPVALLHRFAGELSAKPTEGASPPYATGSPPGGRVARPLGPVAL